MKRAKQNRLKRLPIILTTIRNYLSFLQFEFPDKASLNLAEATFFGTRLTFSGSTRNFYVFNKVLKSCIMKTIANSTRVS
jgi:hypothetical protein